LKIRNTLQKAYLIFGFLIIISCEPKFNTFNENADEYEIFLYTINDLIENNYKKDYKHREGIYINSYTSISSFVEFDNYLNSVANEVSNDFKLKNSKKHQISDFFFQNNIGFQKLFIDSISQKTSDEIGYLKKLDPKFLILIKFSRVGFDKNKSSGIVYVEYYFEEWDSAGIFYEFIRYNGKWIINRKNILWIS
jgi:hypothetical protein